MFRRPERAEKQDVPTRERPAFRCRCCDGRRRTKGSQPPQGQKNILDTAKSNQRQTARILRNTGYRPFRWSGCGGLS